MLLSYYKKGLLEAGCDEAGRGCLAGPVFAAAVILPDDFSHPFLTDSKQLTEKQRYSLRPEIEKSSIAWAVAMVDNVKIDEINILWASVLAMHLAIEKLKILPKHLIIDGNRFKKYQKIPHCCIIQGDEKYYSIAAASVLAKTYRDDYMIKLHEEYNNYSWLSNKGYPTPAHKEAINLYGITKYHRKSFKLSDDQLELEF